MDYFYVTDESAGSTALVAIVLTQEQGISFARCPKIPHVSIGGRSSGELATRIGPAGHHVLQDRTGAQVGGSSPWWTWLVLQPLPRQTGYSMHSLHQTQVANIRAAHRAFWRFVSRQALRMKGEIWYVYGAWVRRDSLSDEHIINSKAGVFQSRSVHRMPPDRRWSQDAVNSKKRTPWKTVMRGRSPRQFLSGEPIVNDPLPTIREASRYDPNAAPAAAAPSTAATAREGTTTTLAPPAVHPDQAMHPQDT